jgi:hypothetical protein
MLRELIEKEVSAVKDVVQKVEKEAVEAKDAAVHTVREWIKPTKVMKGHAFDRPLDDLGQTIDDVERRAGAPSPPPEKKP